MEYRVYGTGKNYSIISTKTGQIGLPQKGQKQVTDLQRNALTPLIHFAMQTAQSGLGI